MSTIYSGMILSYAHKFGEHPRRVITLIAGVHLVLLAVIAIVGAGLFVR